MTRIRRMFVPAIALVLAVTFVAAAQEQRPARRSPRGMGTRGSLIGLVSLGQVQKELKLNEEQIGKVKKVVETLTAEMRKEYGALREIEDRQKRREKMTELGKQFDEKARGQLRDLLSEEQMMRLYQIRLQVRGAVYGLNNKWIAGRLKLTDDQKKKAAELEKATQEKIFGTFSGLRDLSREERREKMAELREKIRKIRSKAGEQALGLLNAEQKETFERIKGEKLEL